MGANTNIEWCDSTINPTTGCEGCELWNGRQMRQCYAGNLHEDRLAKSLPTLYAPSFQEVRLAPGRMMKAANWPDLRGKERPEKPWLNGLPRMIFVGDMGDIMSRSVPTEYIIKEIFGAITSPAGQRHFWLLLTKKPNRLAYISQVFGKFPDNCMAMTSITDQATADRRLYDLLDVNCRWRGISAEPLLSAVDLLKFFNPTFQPFWKNQIHWLITGGESGNNARPAHPHWFRSLRDQCVDAEIPFFFKQWGGINKKATGRELDGRTWDEMPKL